MYTDLWLCTMDVIVFFLLFSLSLCVRLRCASFALGNNIEIASDHLAIMQSHIKQQKRQKKKKKRHQSSGPYIQKKVEIVDFVLKRVFFSFIPFGLASSSFSLACDVVTSFRFIQYGLVGRVCAVGQYAHQTSDARTQINIILRQS